MRDALIETGLMFGGAAGAGYLAWLLPVWLGVVFVGAVVLGGFASLLLPPRGEGACGPW